MNAQAQTAVTDGAAEEARADASAPVPVVDAIHGDAGDGVPGALTMGDEKLVAAWCRRYGVTGDQLALAAARVGLMPAALHFYLTSRGRPTKAVTNEMRASRPPIRPRDRRGKPVGARSGEGPADDPLIELEQLRLERSAQERNVRIAADALHQQPRPSTIHAYDAAQRSLDETVARLEAAERAATSRASVIRDA